MLSHIFKRFKKSEVTPGQHQMVRPALHHPLRAATQSPLPQRVSHATPDPSVPLHT